MKHLGGTHMSEINIKETIKFMKKELNDVKNYSATIRLQSILYGEYNEILQVEDEVSDYVHYTKSIVQASKTRYHDKKDVVLDAMMRQQRHHETMKLRDAQSYVVIQGIAQLEKKERELLFDIYVRQHSRAYIMNKEGGIVESTYHRRVKKAMLNLAIILHREIYQ